MDDQKKRQRTEMMQAVQQATTILSALDNRRSITPLTGQSDGLTLPEAYRISRAVTSLRIARGEKPIGRKIGFTNRTIWDEYGVHHPIDGPMFDTTVSQADGPVPAYPLSRFVEPRIEPEIVFGLSAQPVATADETSLIQCIDWVAHGFEIVQSLYPGWRFKGADCVAAFGLHGALICGPRQRISASDRAPWQQRLTRFSIELARNGETIDTGHAQNVLGGPLSALLHLVRAIAADPEAPPLQAGDMITTGTVTRAFPITAGDRWNTRLSGLDLPGMDVTFTDQAMT